ncbi:MAG: polyphosphate kinase 1 [Myxococcota bacterium]|nr:polyphosphate kinase 1 [Myxococcota bacterium]
MNPPESNRAEREPEPQAQVETIAEPTPLAVRTRAGVPTPVPEFQGEPDLSSPELYLNRELTWLGFNYRVLHEAADERTPLLERVKFLAIVGSNLDEFVMKRIGGLKQQAAAGMREPTIDGRTPEQQIADCYDVIRDLYRREREVLAKLVTRLAEHDIVIARYEDLDDSDRAWLRDYYYTNIFPLVTPQAMDPAHPFPFISNLSLNLLVTVRQTRDDTLSLARVKVPVGTGIPRLLRVQERDVFVPLEQVMANNLDLLLPGIQVEDCELFRVTRNANTERDEDQADDLLALIETELRERKFAPIVRLAVEKGMSPLHRGMLAAELGLDEESDVVEVEGMLGTRDLMELAALDLPELHDPPHHPIDHARLTGDRPIFHAIRDAGSILLQHPYESFSSSVERLLREASEDPKVRAIKMTLYRTSAKTNVIKHLVNAAQNGKQVAVVVELKARFDESANIQWASRLEEAGIHVTYGVVGLKTHCKVILVVRQDYNGLTRYAHVGTGNYHAGTARMYSDLGLLTSDDAIGQDLTELFNYLSTGYKPKRRYRKLLPAPTHLKRGLLDRIQREIDLHTPESPGLIQFKMNALEDTDVTRALYEAARAGVQVDLIVRDTCRLRPGIPGLSEKVRVISIVGRFLEHARIYYFRNGGESEYYIGSADLMKRNLESRVESVVPVEDPKLQEELRFVLDTQLGDMRSAWEMQPDGTYRQRVPGRGRKGRSSQETLAQRADKRLKDATRLRKRRPKGVARRGSR